MDEATARIRTVLVEHARLPVDVAGLGEELQEDGRAGGAERLAHAHLAGALGDRDEHDVHDPDPAHEQTHRGHAREQVGEHLRRLGGGGEEVGLVADLEVVGAAGGGAVPGGPAGDGVRHAHVVVASPFGEEVDQLVRRVVEGARHGEASGARQ